MFYAPNAPLTTQSLKEDRMAIGSLSNLLFFPKQSKPAPPKDKKPEKPKPKATVLEWIRNGYQFPGKPAPSDKGGA